MRGERGFVEGDFGGCARLDEELAVDVTECAITVPLCQRCLFWCRGHCASLTVPQRRSCSQSALRAWAEVLPWCMKTRVANAMTLS